MSITVTILITAPIAFALGYMVGGITYVERRRR